MTTIPRHDEYRAVIETHDYRWQVIAKGDYTWARDRLDEWLDTNPLQPLHTAYLLRVHTRTPGPLPPHIVLGREVTT